MAMSSMRGNTWQHMATHGITWHHMATHGHLWPHMATLEVAGCALEGLLQDLGSVAQEAAQELGPGASSDEVAAHAVKAGWKEMVTGRSYMEAWGFNSIEDGEDAFYTNIHVDFCDCQFLHHNFERMEPNVAVSSWEIWNQWPGSQEVGTDRLVNIVLLSPELNLVNYLDLTAPKPHV